MRKKNAKADSLPALFITLDVSQQKSALIVNCDVKIGIKIGIKQTNLQL